MAWVEKYTINGIEFTFIEHDSDVYGVIIPPDADLFDPIYQDALKTAKSIWNEVFAFARIRESVWGVERDGTLYVSESELQTHYNTIRNGKYIKPHENYLKRIEQALDPEFRKLRQKQYSEESQPKPKKQAGYVYLVKSPTGAYKIGRAKDPRNRIKTFGVQLPFEVEYICLIKTPDMCGCEERLHAYFAEKRINGEWFALEPEDVEYLKQMAQLAEKRLTDVN